MGPCSTHLGFILTHTSVKALLCLPLRRQRRRKGGKEEGEGGEEEESYEKELKHSPCFSMAAECCLTWLPRAANVQKFDPSMAAHPVHSFAYVNKQKLPQKDGGGHMTAPNKLVLANSRQHLFSCSLIMDAALQCTPVCV